MEFLSVLPVFAALTIGIGLGGAAGWAFARARAAREVAEQTVTLARLTAQLEAERQTAADRQALLESADTRLRDVFASVSAEALRAKTAFGDFQKQATTDL